VRRETMRCAALRGGALRRDARRGAAGRGVAKCRNDALRCDAERGAARRSEAGRCSALRCGAMIRKGTLSSPLGVCHYGVGCQQSITPERRSGYGWGNPCAGGIGVTANEFRDALQKLGWSQTKAAQRLGLSLRQINRYASGQTPVKRPVEIVLRNAAELARRS